MRTLLDKVRADLTAGEEAILSAAGTIKTPRHLASSFLDGKFRDARPSKQSFLIADEESET